MNEKVQPYLALFNMIGGV